MPRFAQTVTMSSEIGGVVDGMLASASRVSARLHERLQMVRMASRGKLNVEIAAALGVDPQRPRRWRKRWARRYQQLNCAQQRGVTRRELEVMIDAILADNRGRGTRGKFSAQQLTKIIAVAGEKPADSGIPTTHWTASDLAREVRGRGIVDSISDRHVGRLLSQGDLRPHMSRYWLTSKDKLEDPEAYEEAIREICQLYSESPELYRQDIFVVSTDERTGLQAIERKHPTLPMRPGLIERREFEYIRHGTLCLTCNLVVATGKVLRSTISETRTESDFVTHIAQTVSSAPDAGWIFVADQLNTHISAGLVRFVATACGLTEDLGVKGKSGVLRSMKTRKAFLSDPTHRIRFVYTPRHCSWMTQVEIWFSILSRRLLRRGSFAGKADLKERLVAFIEFFIEFFNEVLAKPFKWTYAGKPLAV